MNVIRRPKEDNCVIYIIVPPPDEKIILEMNENSQLSAKIIGLEVSKTNVDIAFECQGGFCKERDGNDLMSDEVEIQLETVRI